MGWDGGDDVAPFQGLYVYNQPISILPWNHRQQLGGSYVQYRARVAQIFRESVAKEQGGYTNLFRGLTPVRADDTGVVPTQAVVDRLTHNTSSVFRITWEIDR